MALYLIKSIIVLSLCLGIYLLLLEREKMHRFNRMFLMLALLAGLYIPTINFEVAIPSPEIYNSIIPLKSSVEKGLEKSAKGIKDSFNEGILVADDILYSEGPEAANTLEASLRQIELATWVLVIVYMTGFLIAVLQFVLGIYHMSRQLKSGKMISVEGSRICLLDEKVVPHSFLTFIFLNRQDYEQGHISKEVLHHELSHTQQWHTMDLLFFELIHILFWFNPLMLLYKRAIKENHEFLADAAVLEKSEDISGYQQLLLSAVSSKPPAYLSSTFTYRLTKKRLLLMARESSRLMMRAKQFAIVPIMLSLLVIFGAKERPTSSQESLYKSTLGKDYIVYQFISEEGYYSDTILHIPVEPTSEFPHLKRAFDENGDPFTGQQSWYFKGNDDLVHVYTYENGYRTEVKRYEKPGKLKQKQLMVYENGQRVESKNYVYEAGQERLLSYSKTVNGVITTTDLFESGKIRSEWSFKWKGTRDQPPRAHGKMTSYDEQGNIVRQSLWDNGELIEVIK